MGKKYIKQIISQNFVYPNNDKDEYDIEIIHDINNNCVSGNVVTFSASTFTSSSIVLDYNFGWNANGAELYQMEDGNYSYVSIHMMSPTQVYMKPYRVVHNIESATLYSGTTTFSGSTTITPSQLGLTSFTSGTYYCEVRFIGHRCLYRYCVTLSLVTPTPTPTPTASVTPTQTVTPTPTMTQTQGTPTPTPTPTETPITCLCYYILNETAGSLNYTYYNCETGETTNPLGGGQNIQVCSSQYPTGDGGITITPCVSVTNCNTNTDCTGCSF